MARIELKGIRKSFDATEVLRGVDLTIENGAATTAASRFWVICFA
jgi:ABC-type sugar transport system ATPase subunit